MPQILVYGATGFTGSLVAHELERQGLSYRLAGRNQEKLEALQSALPSRPPVSVAQIDNPDALKGILQGMKVVINTAGPFTDLGEPVFRAAIEQGVHYLDTTGEQEFMQTMFDRYDQTAVETACVAVCAHAFEYAIGDCAAALAAQALGGLAERLEVIYKVPAFSTSRGTAKSILRAIVQKGGYWEDGQWKKESPPGASLKLDLDGKPRVALSFAGGEAVHLHRKTGARSIRSYMCFPPKTRRKIRMSGPLIPLLRIRAIRNMADRKIDKQPVGPDLETRAKQRFVIVARAFSDSETRTCTVNGVDPYGLTAQIAVHGARTLLKDPPAKLGVVSSSLCFEPEDVLNALSSETFSWTITAN